MPSRAGLNWLPVHYILPTLSRDECDLLLDFRHIQADISQNNSDCDLRSSCCEWEMRKWKRSLRDRSQISASLFVALELTRTRRTGRNLEDLRKQDFRSLVKRVASTRSPVQTSGCAPRLSPLLQKSQACKQKKKVLRCTNLNNETRRGSVSRSADIF